MMCSDHSCRGSLRVTHTYTVGQEKFQRATCSECGTVYRLSTTATPVTARGEGAKAHAARARKLCEAPASTPF